MGSVTTPPDRAARTVLRSVGAGMARWLAGASYLRKWLVLGVLIGAIAGCGAIVFYEALRGATRLFLDVMVGYQVPTPVGEGGLAASAGFARPWALPLVVGLGAALAGALVFRFAPEAEGHGTDAAIAAVHDNPRSIRFRAVVVKIIASALTIGSGGSGGREGPTGQISAGFGSLLARVFDLSPADARVAVATGIGSGIGSIFGAPLGGAVLSTEILYRDDVDVASLLPCFIASAVGYAIFGGVEGFTPLFGYHGGYRFTDPLQLVWFAVIGVLGGVIGLAYAKGFYGLVGVFGRIRAPRWTKPAAAGVLVGLVGLAVPEVLGTGYGWIQQSLGRQLLGLPLWIVVVLPFARILATGLSIGSGGSGGIFGPGMVIGAFVGAAFWRLLEPVAPSLGHSPTPYVIVGMMCCFGSISRAPLAVTLMVAEMTGSVAILAPAMLAVGIAWLIVRRSDDTIYRSQLKSRAAAPAQQLLVGMPLLANVGVAEAMAPPRLVLPGGEGAAAGRERMEAAGVPGAPVVDEDGRFVGAAFLERLRLEGDAGDEHVLGSLADVTTPTVSEGSTLDDALDALTTAPQGWLPVVDGERRVVGTLAVSDLVRGYRIGLLSALGRVTGMGAGTGASEVEIAEGSALAGRSLTDPVLPPGTLVTSISRGRDLVTPVGRTVLEMGDRLTVVGRPEAVSRLAELARPPG